MSPHMHDGGSFGRWSADAEGLPRFDFAADPGARLVLPEGDARRCWHQVGNDRVIATAHAGGWTTLYFCDRGFLRLSDPDPARPARLGGVWSVFDAGGARLLWPFTAGAIRRASWGMGYAEWEAEAGGVSLCRRVWAPFGDLPVLRADVSICGAAGGTYEERWGLDFYPLLLGGLMTRWSEPPGGHSSRERLWWRAMMAASSASRAVTERLRRAYRKRLGLRLQERPHEATLAVVPEYDGPFKARSLDQPAWFDSYPKPVYFAALHGPLPAHRLDGDGIALRAPIGDGTAEFSFLVGSIEETKWPALLAEARAATREQSAQAWRRQVRVQIPELPWAGREAAWHGYYLRSAQVRDDYFGARILPQGSAYGYVHGLHGAVRDYALAAVPLAFLDPDGARDNLRLIMQMTRANGVMYYSHAGFGKCTSAAMHDWPTDLPLFFLWALSEYVWASGARDFLDEVVPFYPRHDGASSTVRERVLLAWRYLRSEIGTGEHGLLRCGSGDWSDPISLMVESRRAFYRRGESGFNTAFAVYVLPRAADLIADRHPEIAAQMRQFSCKLWAAMDRAWTGRWFLRGWDGRGNPIGAEHLFLDGQVWALIAGIGGEQKCRTLIEEIRTRLDDPSPIGAMILDRPHPVRMGALGKGWDCNGGVWAAINGLLCWAYSLYEPELAWRNWKKQSLAAHATAYPNVWYGIWSGPDAYNAHYADHAGETFLHPATPMQEFPVMNSNAHALPLLALLRLAGVETTRDGVRIRRQSLPGDGWEVTTPLLRVTPQSPAAEVRVAAETRPRPEAATPAGSDGDTAPPAAKKKAPRRRAPTASSEPAASAETTAATAAPKPRRTPARRRAPKAPQEGKEP